MVGNLKALFGQWGGRFGFSILDQFASSGANFALNVLLVRWLPPDQYGVFAITFSVFQFVTGIFSAVIVEPMMVLASSRFESRIGEYQSRLLLLQGGLGVGLGVITALLAAALRYLGSPLFGSVLSMAVALPPLLFLWVGRQFCYVEARAKTASAASAGYLVLLLFGLGVYHRYAGSQPGAAFLIMGGSALLSGGALWILVRPRPPGSLGSNRLEWREVLREHWGFGWWILLAGMAHNLSNALYVPLVGGVMGLAEAGTLRAMQILVTPLQQVLTALGQLTLPLMSRRSAQVGRMYLKAVAPKFLAGTFILALAYVLPLALAGRWMVLVLYGQSRYLDTTWMLPALCLTAMFGAIAGSIGILLRAIRRPDAILWSKVGASLVTLTGGIALIRWQGFMGVVHGLLATVSIELVILLPFLRSPKSAPSRDVAS